MKAKAADWYKKNWSLDIKNMSWVENTPNEVDFIIDMCKLNGIERILDLACGYGRHSLEFAKRGFEVVGVDITPCYIEDAGEEEISLSEFDWDPETKIMLFGNQNFAYGQILSKPHIAEGDPTRVYTLDEMKDIMSNRHMSVVEAFAGYSKKVCSQNDFQMLVHSRKK